MENKSPDNKTIIRNEPFTGRDKNVPPIVRGEIIIRTDKRGFLTPLRIGYGLWIRFSNRLSEGLKKRERRFISDIIYGIQASKDVKLSEISRALEEDIKLLKTETRLSRNIGKLAW